jgi:hypothetical protein
MQMLKYFLKHFKKNFAHKKLKKPPSKVAQNSSSPLFFPYCPDCPNGPMWPIDQLYIELGFGPFGLSWQ